MPALPQRRTPTATIPGLRSDASESESPRGCSGSPVGMLADPCRTTIVAQTLRNASVRRNVGRLTKVGPSALNKRLAQEVLHIPSGNRDCPPEAARNVRLSARLSTGTLL